MNARDHLNAGRTATQEGRFEEALAHCVWFHEHALEETRAYRGVRLSFAIADWLELAEQYPPALAEFRARRDEKLARLSAGELSRDLFHDVEVMSQALAEDEKTAELFGALDSNHPEFAQRCAVIAVRMLVRVKRFSLAAKYIGEPVQRILFLAQRLQRDADDICDIDGPLKTRKRVYRGHVHLFAEEVLRFEEILRETGSVETAAQLRVQALEALETAYLRNAVARELMSKN